MRRLMGLEIEFGITSRDQNGRLPSASTATMLVERARRRRPHLPHSSNGVFFDTGDRFYVDQGSHPEWCTPECSDMTDVVCYVRAAEARLEAILREMPGILLLRSNIDYASHATWGCHESHAHRCDPAILEPILVPHLVSRIIYTGAGGLNPYHAGITPCLSPRAMNFWRRSSPSRTVSIYDTRDEPHAGLGYRRCHIVLGDTLCADLPLWLRLGTTSLIIAMADAGAITPGDLPELQDPVAALHTFCEDPTLVARAPTVTADGVTAIDIQRRYLDAARSFSDRVVAPDWAALVCAEWGAILERLETGPEAVATTCEWAIKRTIFEDQARRAGFDRARLDRVGGDLARLQAELPRTVSLPRRLRPEPTWNVEAHLAELGLPAIAHGVDLDELHELLSLRQRLCEIDIRYGQIPDGLFDAISGALDHAAPGVDEDSVQRAMCEPPRGTRASLRGHMIRELSGASVGVSVDWSRIDDRQSGRTFGMPDPFATKSTWKARRPPRMPSERLPFERMLDTVSRYYNQGNFNRVGVLLNLILSRRPSAPPPPPWAWAYRAWVESRGGCVARALSALDHFESRFERQADGQLAARDAADQIVNRVAVLRFQGLRPDPSRLRPWLERGDSVERANWPRETLVSYLGHKGHALSRQGRIDAAVSILRGALEIPLDRANHLRIAARIRCDLADCLRLVGQTAEAHRQLEAAERTFLEHRFRGDQADHWAPTVVKLDPTADATREILRRAYTVQRRDGHPVGAVRTLLLRARITRFQSVATRCRRQVERDAETVPDLGRCPLLRSILDRWDEWAMRYPEPAVDGDPFWLL